jgi:hypothetical protein
MKRTTPYLSVVLIALMALLCGCVAENFAELDDRPLNEDAGADGGGSTGDASDVADVADVDESDSGVIECETNEDCADEANANQTGVCQTSTGTCRFPCNSPYLDCDGDRSNGCEVDENTDADHCGTCGNACEKDSTNYVPICLEGGCDVDPEQCAEDFVDVDSAVPGCECEITNRQDEPGDGRDTDCDGVDG